MENTRQIYSTLESDPVLGELIQIFVDTIPDRIETLLAQAAAEDWELLGRTAHQLKGAFASHGFPVLTVPAHNLEVATSDRHSEDQILGALNELLEMCRRVRYGA